MRNDDGWFDALAGRADATTGAVGDGEGQLLRAAILAQAAAQETVVRTSDPAREAALIERARGAGILPAEAPAGRLAVGRARVPRWYGRWPAGLVAAAIAGVAISVTWQMRTRPVAEVERGAASGIVRISVADPIRLRQELVKELDAAGVHAIGYSMLGHQGVDADLPTPVPPAVRQVLKRHGIAIPRNNVLQIEIEPTAP